MPTLHVTRAVRLPDPARLALYRKSPELGPRVLFFSGGSALRDVSRRLIEYTHNSIHLITPFDSGGSSAQLREAFKMLAVGDVRNRLMALADRSFQGNPEIFQLFAFRFPHDATQKELRKSLAGLVSGKDPMIAVIPDPMRRLVRNHIGFFAEAMPERFDLRGANIGNLILAGGYLNQNRHIDPVIYLFSRLVAVRGIVRPVANEYLHLAAELADGRTIVGQHLLTGKESPPLDSPIRRLYLTRKRRDPQPARLPIRDKIEGLIASAHLICYPIGSFYSSLVANLLVAGVGDAVAKLDVPKVFVPNLGHDPELFEMPIAEQVETIVHYLSAGVEKPPRPASLVRYLLVDERHHRVTADDRRRLAKLEVELVNLPLVTEASTPLLDPQALVEALVSMAG